MDSYVSILNVPFSTLDQRKTVRWTVERVERNEKVHMVTANPEIVMLARREPDLLAILQKADIVTPDGIGIVWAARQKGRPLPERVAGYDLMHALMYEADRRGWGVFLIGADEQTNERAFRTLARQYPGARMAGRRNGYFQEEETPEVIEGINEARPALLFVGLGAPRQERWISAHIDRLDVCVAVGVGGSLDVLAGRVKRAPRFWQNVHLEWLYRLLAQPSRWRRQMDLPRFVLSVLRDR